MKLASTRVLVLVLLLISRAAAAVSAANNRPLIFGMNPTPMDWWGYDKYVWDPLLFQKMAEAGCATARIGINWDVIEPAPGVRDWTEIDRWVKLCLDNNIEPLILINSTPTWALPDYVDPAVAVPEARYPVGAEYTSVFDQWCFDVARRFRGRARYYEFWNEANGYGWYTALLNPPSYSRFDLYTPWMIRAYRSVKLADPASQMSTTGIDDRRSHFAVSTTRQDCSRSHIDQPGSDVVAVERETRADRDGHFNVAGPLKRGFRTERSVEHPHVDAYGASRNRQVAGSGSITRGFFEPDSRRERPFVRGSFCKTRRGVA